MLAWISANLTTLIVAAVLAAILIAIVVSMIRKQKKRRIGRLRLRL